MQIEALKRYGVPAELILVDKASGGSFDNRPGFSRALRMLQHEGSELVVWKLDRIGRTLVGILKIMELLEKRGIGFVSLTERIDTNGAMGKAMLRLMAIFAELERDMIRERTKAGLIRARERGEEPGRPKGMTPERILRAEELMAEGRRGNDVWRELRKIKGPGLSRATYYIWQKSFDAEQAEKKLKLSD